MQIISVDELVDYKILPYNLYNENGDKLMSAGEVLTPGKLLQLRYLSVIYKDDNFAKEPDLNIFTEEIKVEKETKIEKPKQVIESLTIKDGKVLDKETFQDQLYNPKSVITPKTQIKMKSLYTSAVKSIKEKASDASIRLYKDIRDQVIEDVLPIIEKINHKSQLKMVGDYDSYHGLNVAMLSTMLAVKLGLNEARINDIALAALLHDVGKMRLPKDVIATANTSSRNLKLFQLHPQIGYKILKNEMNMSEIICKVALEHHEKNDGSGYPYCISGDLITQTSQIISVCNIYDNLVSGKGNVVINTPKEAVKQILEAGTSWFSPDVLYTFVHMTSYNDDTPIEEFKVQVK